MYWLISLVHKRGCFGKTLPLLWLLMAWLLRSSKHQHPWCCVCRMKGCLSSTGRSVICVLKSHRKWNHFFLFSEINQARQVLTYEQVDHIRSIVSGYNWSHFGFIWRMISSTGFTLSCFLSKYFQIWIILRELRSKWSYSTISAHDEINHKFISTIHLRLLRHLYFGACLRAQSTSGYIRLGQQKIIYSSTYLFGTNMKI